MSVSAVLVSKVTVTETIEDALLAASSRVVHSGMDSTLTINADSSVPATLVASFEKTMSAGAGTIDLRALVGTNAGAIDGNGLKVQAIKFRSKSTNANNITITEGASNGYPLLGAGFTFILPPGGEAMFSLLDQAGDVSATDKTIDISGTGSQVLQCIVVLG